MSEYLETSGIALNDEGDEWEADCPNCMTTYIYEGFFDPEEECGCACGAIFVITYLECEDGKIIK